MVAESLDYRPAPVGLLYEPEHPSERAHLAHGWRRVWRKERNVRVSTWVRRQEDDEYGARVQEAICMYVLRGQRRPEIAAFLAMSERQTADILVGKASGCYGAPLLRAFDRLGIRIKRPHRTEVERRGQIIRAQADALDRCRALLGGVDFNEGALAELQADLRLLALVVES